MFDRERFFTAENYVLYYGCERTEELSQYDLAILEPAGQNDAALRSLQRKGTLALAYVSALEITNHSDFLKLAAPGDLLKQGEEPILNQEYKTMLADLCSERWRNFVLHTVGKLLLINGYNGIFLDTLGDLEWETLSSSTRQTQLLAAAHLLAELRRRFPQAVLIQNNGLEQVATYTAPYLDGLCWENPPWGAENIHWTQNLARHLVGLQQTQGLKILILEERAPGNGDDNAARMARGQRFLYYRAPGSYTAGITPLKGKE